jgi:hypothetical protein
MGSMTKGKAGWLTFGGSGRRDVDRGQGIGVILIAGFQALGGNLGQVAGAA